jgi:hypothetical protein
MPSAASDSADRLRRYHSPLVTAGLTHGSSVAKALELELTRDVPLLPPAAPLPSPETAARTTAVPSQTNGHEERPFLPPPGTG